MARATLGWYLDALNAGCHDEVAQLYGGSYEQLIEYNPGLVSTNKPALLKAACTINGFQCLKVSAIKDDKNSIADRVRLPGPVCDC